MHKCTRKANRAKILRYCKHENGGCTLYLIVVNLGQVASREKKKQREEEQMIVHSCTIFPCCLHGDAPYKDPNINNKDQRVGSLQLHKQMADY